MYLAIMLIIIAILVFYNEINTKMNIAEYILLAISLIAIIKASISYINIDTIKENFTVQHNNKNKKNKNEFEDEDEDIITMKSEESEEYLDSDEIPDENSNKINMNINSLNSIDNAKLENKLSSSAVQSVNELLGINNVSKFTDIPVPTSTSNQNNDSEINSTFNPKVIIRKGKNNRNDNYNGFGSNGNTYNWNSVFNDDGFGFNNTMYPTQNLWRDTHGCYNVCNKKSNGIDDEDEEDDEDDGDQWTKSMDSYNRGKWNRNLYNRPSDYIDYTSTSTNSRQSSSQKKCGKYDDLEDQSGNLIIKDYSKAKKWVAGYTYVPPINWDVPQRRAPVCNSPTPNVRKLTGIMDRGLPLNALEINQDGKIADTEDTVNLTNIGSLVRKFNYEEEPFSKPYV